MKTKHTFTISRNCKLYFNQKESFKESQLKKNLLHLLKQNPSSICNYIPKDFIITTRGSSCKFNKYFLKETSATISNYLEDHQNELTYHLDIDDPKNVLGKFEQLYLGQKVIFQKEDIQTCQKITKLLFITCCPNFMKPKSLWCEKNNKSANDITLPVRLKGIINFLNDSNYKTFTISTKNNTYRCNIFNVYLSDVIRAQLEEDPNNNHFFYDFEDDCNEFQLICDLFNLQSIQITRSNINSLIEIVEDLKITCLLNDIDYIVKNSEKFNQKIDDNQTVIDSIDELFDWLYNIKEKSVKTVVNLILQSEWIETEENVQELVAFLLEVISTNNLLHPYIFDLIIDLNGQSNESNHLKVLLPFIIQKMITCLINDKNAPEIEDNDTIESINTNQFIYAFIYKFYRKGIIPKNTLINSLKNYDFQNLYINLWFLPLFAEMDENNINQIFSSNRKKNQDINDFVRSYLPYKMDIYEKILDNGEPDDSLIKALHNDDVDTVQKITTEMINKKEKEITIPFNLFDYFLLRNQSILNYAAAYGSLKCFKYLLLNNNHIDDKTFELAIYGGNIEIIKIVDQNNEFNNNEKQNDILFAIRKHKNDLFDWLIEKIPLKDLFMYNIAKESAIHGNAHCLTEIIDKGFNITDKNYTEIIQEASRNGFYKFLLFIKSISPAKTIGKKLCNINRKKANKEENDLCTIHFGNLSIFKLFIYEITQNDIVKYICFAVKNDYISIINYYFEEIIEHEKDSSDSIKEILEVSLHRNDANIFDCILQKVHSLNLSIKIDYGYLLEKSIKYNNFEAIKEITNIILKDNDDFDFSDGFNEAALSGLSRICQYFIDQKVEINYNSIVEHSRNYGLLNKSIYSIILNQIMPHLKTRFLFTINHAIKSKNHELVDFLFQENSYSDDALWLAADTNDINLVNIVLKYQNDPNLINKVGENGTALIIAAENNNLQIVKKLLSIQGINPSIYDYKDGIIRYPLTVALKKDNIDMINAILDFYGENFQYQNCQLDEAMKIVFKIYMKTRNNDKSMQIVHRFLDIKYINPNVLYTDDAITKNIIKKAPKRHKLKKKKRKIKHNKTKQKNVSNIIKEFLKDFNEEDSEEEDSSLEPTYYIKDTNSFISKIESFLDTEHQEEEDYDFLDKSNLDNNYYYEQNKTKHFEYINKSGSVDTFLLCACARNDIKTVKKLINLDQLDINQYSVSNGDTALIIALKNKYQQIAKLLIENPKTNINQRTFYNETALSIAVHNKLFEIAMILLTDKRFYPEENLIRYVYYISNYDIRKVILSSMNIKLSIDNLSYMLHIAVKNNDVDLIDVIIQNQFFDKNEIDVNDIIISIKSKSFDVFQKLIKSKGNNVNLHDDSKKSLLFHAARVSNMKVLDYILNNEKFDANESSIVKAFNKVYSNSRIRRFQKFQKAVNKYKIQNIDIVTNFIESIKLDIINSMIKLYEYDQKHDHLIDFTKLLPDGQSYFTSFSCYFDGLEHIFDFFIQNGMDPNMPDSKNLYPLENAIIINSPELVKFFINTNKIDYSVKIPITIEEEEEEFFEEEGEEEEFEEKEAFKENYNSKDGEFTTYLHIAIKSGNLEIVNEFLDKNLIDINITNSHGDTPLIEACRHKKYKCIEALFKNDKLDYNHCNNDGYDAIEILTKKKKKEPINDKDEYLTTIIKSKK